MKAFVRELGIWLLASSMMTAGMTVLAANTGQWWLVAVFPVFSIGAAAGMTLRG